MPGPHAARPAAKNGEPRRSADRLRGLISRKSPPALASAEIDTLAAGTSPNMIVPQNRDPTRRNGTERRGIQWDDGTVVRRKWPVFQPKRATRGLFCRRFNFWRLREPATDRANAQQDLECYRGRRQSATWASRRICLSRFARHIGTYPPIFMDTSA
jgi:hypothetical protein